MNGFEAVPIAPIAWRVDVLPGHLSCIERVLADGAEMVAMYDSPIKCSVTPSVEGLAAGLYVETTYYENSLGDVKERKRYMLVYGRFSLVHLGDALGAAFEAVVKESTSNIA